jgi:hypothetical protein
MFVCYFCAHPATFIPCRFVLFSQHSHTYFYIYFSRISFSHLHSPERFGEKGEWFDNGKIGHSPEQAIVVDVVVILTVTGFLKSYLHSTESFGEKGERFDNGNIGHSLEQPIVDVVATLIVVDVVNVIVVVIVFKSYLHSPERFGEKGEWFDNGNITHSLE